MCAVDHLNVCIVTMRDGGEDTITHARATPLHKPIVAGGVGPIALGKIAPRGCRSLNPEDAVHGAPVIHTRNAAWLAGQDSVHKAPLGVGDGISHDRSFSTGLESCRRPSFNDCFATNSGRPPDDRKGQLVTHCGLFDLSDPLHLGAKNGRFRLCQKRMSFVSQTSSILCFPRTS